MVLGDEEAVEAGALGGDRQLDLVLVHLGRRPTRGLDPVENAVLHQPLLSTKRGAFTAASKSRAIVPRGRSET